MENFNVKSKTEFNLRTGEKKQIIEALVVKHGIPKISRLGNIRREMAK